MLVRSVEYTPLSHPHIHHQNTYEVIQVDLYDLKSRQTKTIFKRPDSTDPNTPMIYYPKQKTLEFKFQQPKDTSYGVRYDDYSISR